MTQKVLTELEERSPRYLLWTNRIFPEYKAPVFGKDFNVELGNYLKQRYHRLGLLPPHEGGYGNWQVAVWEHNYT